jgi:hypothetical protein
MKLKDVIYEQILNEVRQSDVIFSHRGRAIVDTKHATERYIERLNLPKDYFDKFFTDMINKVLQIEHTKQTKSKNSEMPEEIFIYSPSYDQALVVSYRYDRFDKRDPLKNFYIMTYLPKGETVAKIGTFKTLIEQHDNSMLNASSDMLAYLSGIVNKRNVKITEATEKFDYTPVVLANGLDHKIIVSNNKIYDLSIPHIEID